MARAGTWISTVLHNRCRHRCASGSRCGAGAECVTNTAISVAATSVRQPCRIVRECISNEAQRQPCVECGRWVRAPRKHQQLLHRQRPETVEYGHPKLRPAEG